MTDHTPPPTPQGRGAAGRVGGRLSGKPSTSKPRTSKKTAASRPTKKKTTKPAGYPRDPEKRPGKRNTKKVSKKKAPTYKRGGVPKKGRARKAPYRPEQEHTETRAPQNRGTSLPSEDQLAKSIITGRPIKRKNIRAGKGDTPGPFKKPSLRVFTTTLWDYPSQHYGNAIQGNKNFVGATPSWVVWQLIQRYTDIGGLVVDPMCGSGTTIDVAKDTGREVHAFDLAPTRDDMDQSDARSLPLEDNVADLVFIDPPYSTHIDYSDHPDCIGKLDSAEEPPENQPANDYYRAMADVFDEAFRVLKPGGHLAVYVSDSFTKRDGYMPIGFELFAVLCSRFDPIDTVAVVRRNEKLDRGNFHKAAEEQNFFLRGFNFLFIVQKPRASRPPAPRKKTTSKRTSKKAPSGPRTATRSYGDKKTDGKKTYGKKTHGKKTYGKKTYGKKAYSKKAPTRRSPRDEGDDRGPSSRGPARGASKRTSKRNSPLGPRARNRRGNPDKPGSI